jgi:hypothetical protein
MKRLGSVLAGLGLSILVFSLLDLDPRLSASDEHATSVITPIMGGGQSQITPFATLNWTTDVASAHTAGGNSGNAVAVDSSGNIYVTGYTDNSTSQNPNQRMGFVAEYNQAGTQVAYTAFQAQDPVLGGVYNQTEGRAIAVDNNGGVYVAGKATYMTTASDGTTIEEDTDAFLMKFDATNQLMAVSGYGGAIGGPYEDSGEGVAVDAQGEATITGTFQSTSTETDLFVARFTADGTDTFFANYYQFGGASGSVGKAVALSSSGQNAFIAGYVQQNGGDQDILVLQIDNTTTGNQVYMYTMSNPGNDILNGIAVDANGQAWVAGTLAVMSGGTNAYVAGVSGDGSTLLASYLLPNTQLGTSISLDPNTGNVYVVSTTTPDSSNNVHGFVQKFTNTLAPGDSTFIIGNGADMPLGVAYDANSGNAYVVGMTTSSNLSTDGTTLAGSSDAFLSNVGSWE